MVQILIEFFGFFWFYLGEILLIERFLKVFGIDPHSKKVHHVVIAHVVQIVLVVLIIWFIILFYLTFMRVGLYL